ncbi:hypothetical protein SMKI_08G1830 [Saccharomyces mikatae IFO 1815]|uniref:YHR140W-like protein n=1 Tax=Saccharomyces mikatae IFO 1815 TaxID=226126 RepID=A0AA35J0M7_SACMI|nr:uncharacterized protein SMKI_08G1830 [Saccharomyces mikatae IFO 1815]CAI4039515.1 hypothetical protein SMKI_08G1830 [Saccharomyces mikatae IFO 1815]
MSSLILTKPTGFTLIINTVSLLTSTWGFSRAISVTLPPSLSRAGHKQFLTIISIIAVIINNAVNILNYFMQRNNKVNLECREKSDFISRHVTLPVSLVLESIVASVYWPLRLFFVNLIMHGIDSPAKTPFPITVDMAIHLYPILFLLADHYLSGSGFKFKLSNKHAWFTVTSLAFLYFQYLAFLIDADQGQAYPYPFLDVDEPYKSIIFVVVATITWSYYVIYQKFPPKNAKKTTNKGFKNR